MKLRRFTKEGIHVFREFLAKARLQPDIDVPSDLLEHRSWTEVVVPEIQIASSHFETKGDAARYLSQILKPLKEDEVVNDAGLWTWLALLFFDSICPIENGSRSVKNDYYFIYEPRNMRHFYRHLLFVSWQVLRLAPRHNRLFLTARLNSLDKVTERVMSRLYLTRIPCIFEVLDRLYWDPARGRHRQGITSKDVRPGDLNHRFPLRIRQLEMTYDLMSLSADQLIELLGDEFSFARPKPRQLVFGEDR